MDAGERQVRIEVGYGLEGTLTDAQSFLIIHNVIVPHFRKGDYAGGITAGADAILSVLGGHLQAVQQQQVRDRSGTGFLMLLIVLFVVPAAAARHASAGAASGGAWEAAGSAGCSSGC